MKMNDSINIPSKELNINKIDEQIPGFNPNAATWDISQSLYKVVLGFPDENITPDLQHILDLIDGNESEITNWAAFFRSYSAGRGLLSFQFENEQYSYPPKFISGQEISFLPSELINDLDGMDLNKYYGFVLINKDINLFHAVKWEYPIQIEPIVFEGLQFDYGYTLEEDDAEIYDSTYQLFIDSKNAYLEGNYKKSLVLVNQVIKNNPYYSRAYSGRGQIYELFQDYTYAMACYFDSLEVNPRNWRALYNAGNLYFRIGEGNLGLQYLEIALSINPNFIHGIMSYAHKFNWIGDSNSSMKALEKGLYDNPYDKELIEFKEALLNN